MKFDVLPEARDELQDSALYFDTLRPSKYDAFMAEWHDGISSVGANPRLYSPDEDAPTGFEIRTYLFPRFQRRIIYQVLADRLVIVALAHTRQQPAYWLHRIQRS